MKRFNHKVTAVIMSAILTASALVGCGQTAGSSATDDSAKNETVAVTNETYAANETKDVNSVNKNVPKYIFLFIGDGMSYPQIQ